MYTNTFHVGQKYQRGREIGGLFSTIFRSVIPLGKKLLTSSTTKSIAKLVGKSSKEAAVDTALDALECKNIKNGTRKITRNQSKNCQSY